MTRMNRIAQSAAAVLVLITAGSCNDINRQNSPVTLIVTNTQILTRIDLAGDPPGSTNCQQSIATVNMRAVQLQPPRLLPIKGITGADLNQVRIDRYRVSYVRTDGGRLVPAPFVRSVSALLTTGGGPQDVSGFRAFDPNALNQAPFAALLPQNGGRDPETGKPIISMDLILEIFGETLAGERVTGSTRLQVDFCISCGGCV